MILLFIGPSGSGKDTQAEFLEDKFQFLRVSTGDLMRDISEGDHEIQQLIRKSMNEGFLADNFVFGLMQIYLSDMKADKIIFSGAVRKETQVELLDFTLFKVEKKLDKVIYFDISDEEAVTRMSGRLYCPYDNTNYHLVYNPPKRVDTCDQCGGKLERRDDDNPEAIKARLVDFHKDNEAILDLYEKRGILIKIDASKSIDEVHQEVMKALELS